ncbi:MAG: phosphoglucosamine mutase, partial [Verrucomicrobiota bacterium]
MKDQKRIYFGTDGIRGTFGTPPMTQDFVYRVGKATTEYFKRSTPEPQFIIGRDTRESGYVLEQALVNGINDGGGTTQCVGIIPTAAVAILTTHYKATAGLMISASHNP